MNVLDLFCGAAGGWSLGLERAGYRTVAACEIDPWRSAVFAARHPGCVMYADVRDLTAERLLADLGYLPDIVVGSPPCQEISAANTKGKGITDDHLFWEWTRLVFEVRPLWCAAENSPHTRTSGVDGILDALDTAGYAFWPLVVGAENAGSLHERRRLWLVAADATQLGRHGGVRPSPGGLVEAVRPASGAAFDPPDPDRPRHPLGPREGLNPGEELPPALRAIGRTWPDWNGGLAGLATACAAAGFGAVDDGADAGLPTGMRNRAIAALGDAVIPQIPEAIGRAMTAQFLHTLKGNGKHP